MMLRKLLDDFDFSFADRLTVTIDHYTFTTGFTALRVFYGHYNVVEFHVIVESNTIDSVVLTK